MTGLRLALASLALNACIPPFPKGPIDTATTPNGDDDDDDDDAGDSDGDGFLVPDDCDDTNAAIHPDAVERCDNAIDENCDGIAVVACVPVGTQRVDLVAVDEQFGPFGAVGSADFDGDGLSEVLLGVRYQGYGLPAAWSVQGLAGANLREESGEPFPEDSSYERPYGARRGAVLGSGPQQAFIVGVERNSGGGLVQRIDGASVVTWVLDPDAEGRLGYEATFLDTGAGHAVAVSWWQSLAYPAGALVFPVGSAGGNAITEAQLTIRLDDRGANFGGTIAAGDLDGDGVDELLLGTEPHYNDSAQQVWDPGLVYVLHGDATGLHEGIGDRLDVFAWRLLSDDAFHEYEDRHRWVTAIDVADFDGDGRVELLAGFADEVGLFGAVVAMPDGMAVSGDAYSIDAPLRVVGDGAMRGFGGALAALDDFDGDGRPDLAVGAPRHGSNSGRSYVFSGADLAGTLGPTDALLTLTPEAGARGFGSSLVDAGDMDGDGVGDLAIGELGSTPDDRVYLVLGGALP